MNTVQIVATGPEFIEEGIRGIEPVLEEMISSATEEIQILAYLLQPSAKPILTLLNEAAKRGIKMTIIVNSIQSQPEVTKEWLKVLCSESSLVRVIDFKRQRRALLHAKVLVVDRKKALIGSANFSWGGWMETTRLERSWRESRRGR